MRNIFFPHYLSGEPLFACYKQAGTGLNFYVQCSFLCVCSQTKLKCFDGWSDVVMSMISAWIYCLRMVSFLSEPKSV